jgi:hypothetical protein
MLSNPTSSTLQHWILKGEQAVWPKLSLIKNRLAIELALDRILLRIRQRRVLSDREIRSNDIAAKRKLKH